LLKAWIVKRIENTFVDLSISSHAIVFCSEMLWAR
jgi:hypothetical protein